MAKLDRTFHALADPTRRAVLTRLTEGPGSVGDLARPFDMALPTFLAHLRVLEEGGLIRTEKRGRVRVCELAEGAFAPVSEWLDAQRRDWEARTDRLAAFVEARADPETETADKDSNP